MSTLVKWTPFVDLDVVERRMRRLLGVAPEPLPAADLYETETELVMELDVPGFDEDELTLEVADHTLTVRGERRREKEEEDRTFFLRERLEKHFERRFELPSEADTEHVEARFGNGVLEVHVPKVQPIRARRIEIAKE